MSTEGKADFVSYYDENGAHVRTRLDRLTDGRVMCCICFEFTPRDQLNPVKGDPDGAVEDVCKGCAEKEDNIRAWRASFAHRKTFKVLITGSRTWGEDSAIHNTLDFLLHAAGLANRRMVVVEGECPSGADKSAKTWAIQEKRELGPRRITLEGVPADWDTCAPDCPPGHRKPKRGGGADLHPGKRSDYCPTAGHRRNQDMVDSGADVCLAFIQDGSSGATHCADAARAAGIVTIEWTVTDGVLAEPSMGWRVLVPV